MYAVKAEIYVGDDLYKLKIDCDEISLAASAKDSISKIKKLMPEDVLNQTFFIRQHGSST
jgi:hypothetical protein